MFVLYFVPYQYLNLKNKNFNKFEKKNNKLIIDF